EQALPVGQHERQLGADHPAAEGPQTDSQALAPAQAQGRLRATAQGDADRHRGEHDQRVRPGKTWAHRRDPPQITNRAIPTATTATRAKVVKTIVRVESTQ